MVALPLVRESNSHLKTISNLVAVFVGATQGIGLSTLQQYATLTTAPRIYIIGRSEPAGLRIIDDLKARNPDGNYVFLKGQVSLLESVDEVCREIKRREKRLDLLFMSPGYISFGGRNGEIHLVRDSSIPPLPAPPVSHILSSSFRNIRRPRHPSRAPLLRSRPLRRPSPPPSPQLTLRPRYLHPCSRHGRRHLS